MKGRQKGYVHSEETRRKISEAQKGKPRFYQRGDKHGMWKGDDVTYQGIHSWFRDKKKTECDFCGAKEKIELALKKDKKHEREIRNYHTLCVPCHRKYDAHEAWNKGNKAVYFKECEYCSQKFNGAKKTTRFCSNSCAAKFRKSPMRERDKITGQWLALIKEV